MSLTPKESQAFYEANRIRREEIDDISWVMGMYMLRAVSVALDHGFNGRKARSDYFDKPIMSNMIQQAKTSDKQTETVRKTTDNPEGWTDEQIKQKRKELAMALDVMLYNSRGAEIAKKKTKRGK